MTEQTIDGQNKPKSKLGLAIVGGVVAFFAIALVAAMLLTGGSDDDSVVAAVDSADDAASESEGASQSEGAATPGSDGQELATVTIAGEALPPLPGGVQVSDSSNDSAVGQLAPTLTGTDFTGQTVEIGPGGSAKMVMFLAHWCPHCQREMPVVVQLIEDGKLPSGIEVYAVSTAVDLSRGNPPSGWFSAEEWSGSIVRDDADNSAFSAYGGAGFPYVVYLDSQNRVLTRTAGEFGPDAIEDLWLAIVGG